MLFALDINGGLAVDNACPSQRSFLIDQNWSLAVNNTQDDDGEVFALDIGLGALKVLDPREQSRRSCRFDLGGKKWTQYLL